MLMLLFGYGITFDVDHVAFAVLDRDQTPESRAYIDEFAGSPYFRRDSDLADAGVLIADLRGGHVALAIEIPPGFGADLHRGRPTDVSVWVDGGMRSEEHTSELPSLMRISY